MRKCAEWCGTSYNNGFIRHWHFVKMTLSHVRARLRKLHIFSFIAFYVFRYSYIVYTKRGGSVKGLDFVLYS